jgi:hypothetical protein
MEQRLMKRKAAGIGVELEDPGFGDGEQEQVEGQGIGAATGREPIWGEAWVTPTEARRVWAEALSPNKYFAWISHGSASAGPRNHAGG